jgi:tetratricopeptide (TPR) repeat protein
MERALAATPVPVEVVVEAGFALFDAGRLDGAERAAREATRARPAWSLPWHLLALCARARNLATADVARLLERALTFEPVLPELRFDAARALLDLGEIDRAFDLADQAVNQAPKWPEARELRDRLGSLKTSRCLETAV